MRFVIAAALLAACAAPALADEVDRETMCQYQKRLFDTEKRVMAMDGDPYDIQTADELALIDRLDAEMAEDFRAKTGEDWNAQYLHWVKKSGGYIRC